MAAPQIVPLPSFFTLASGMVIRVTAVDPQTNAVVSGVTVSGVSLDVEIPDSVPPAETTPVTGPFAFGDIAA